ncbi:hypothetical protein HETIRDRAFT_452006 [Heterobasidion irregulare TC 32-1]|uniref:Uncharacterized protein n=1 Tax=Heterobasidion irregulare (strain TC 32-1) TaxID=747525 RepID=W4K4W0_HETIT|nr:uncharacterized protein HETIRDRAFT_452006 [Heterobasidion irregulare TC 32-1]ETW80400.1 hypothetical protein HETIRDRAFT_452006 [Heterobasidion irregulare TC 32-1]
MGDQAGAPRRDETSTLDDVNISPLVLSSSALPPPILPPFLPPRRSVVSLQDGAHFNQKLAGFRTNPKATAAGAQSPFISRRLPLGVRGPLTPPAPREIFTKRGRGIIGASHVRSLSLWASKSFFSNLARSRVIGMQWPPDTK